MVAAALAAAVRAAGPGRIQAQLCDRLRVSVRAITVVAFRRSGD
jgi:hypothetical protein